jgi:hypothetical protein
MSYRKKAKISGINFQRTYLLGYAYKSIKERTLQVLHKRRFMNIEIASYQEQSC